MAILKSETHVGINIAASAVVLTYTHPADKQPAIVLPRVTLGAPDGGPVQGGGNYIANALIDGVSVSPPSAIPFGNGQGRGVLQGRHVAILPNDVLTVTVLGLITDTNVNVTADLFNSTPVQAEDIAQIIGPGTVPVDHNYGGTDKYRYTTASGAGIDNGIVNIYLASDYNAGRRGPEFVKASSRTDVDGRWVRPVNLDPGNYIVYFYKQQAFGPDIATLNVPG